MTNKNITCRWPLAIVSLGAMAMAACGADASGGNPGSETHWLTQCDDDQECGEGSCWCGVCTRPCSDADGCAFPSGPTATCELSATDDRCGSSAPERICLAASTPPNASVDGEPPNTDDGTDGASAAEDGAATGSDIGGTSNDPQSAMGSAAMLDARYAIAGVVLLDDAEDGDGVSLFTGAPALPTGFWYTFDDRCECDNPDLTAGETFPVPVPRGGPEFRMTAYAELSAPPAPITGEQQENLYGLRVYGGGHAYYGAGVGVGLNNSGGLALFDLEAAGFVALRFSVRNATGPATLQLRITDAYSEPSGGNCVARPAEEDRCAFPLEITCSVQGCFDSPAARVEVGDAWQEIEIPLGDFLREGWGSYEEGVEAPDGIDLQRAYQLQFGIMEDTFDLWIDNIGFVR